MAIRILTCDVMEGLAQLADQSVHCVVTSPPYWGLRDYGQPGQIGLEPTPEAFVARLVAVFRDVRRVLRNDGTLWLNLGDSYNAAGRVGHGSRQGFKQGTNRASANGHDECRPSDPALKPKDLIGIPWRVALALQADGWYLRSDIIWAKPNPMPESVTDRPTKSHEYVFLLAKSERYFYDHEAIKEPEVMKPQRRLTPKRENEDTKFQKMPAHQPPGHPPHRGLEGSVGGGYRNKRSVWTISTAPFPEAHFATFPPELPELCIKAGCPKGGTVLDPFSGAGTTAMVADGLGREAIGIERSAGYAEMTRKRVDERKGIPSLFPAVTVEG